MLSWETHLGFRDLENSPMDLEIRGRPLGMIAILMVRRRSLNRETGWGMVTTPRLFSLYLVAWFSRTSSFRAGEFRIKRNRSILKAMIGVLATSSFTLLAQRKVYVMRRNSSVDWIWTKEEWGIWERWRLSVSNGKTGEGFIYKKQ